MKKLLMFLMLVFSASICFAEIRAEVHEPSYSDFGVYNVEINTTTPVQVLWSTGNYVGNGVNNLINYAIAVSTWPNVIFSTTSTAGNVGWIIGKATTYDLPVYWTPNVPFILNTNLYIIAEPAAGAGNKIIQMKRNTR